MEPMAPFPKGLSMDDQSQLAERIVDQVADAIIYADRLGVIIRWNRASAALFGFSAEDALGQSLDLIIPEHLRAPHWRGFEAAITNEAPRPPHANPRDAQERTQTIRRDDLRDRQRRGRRRGAWLGRNGARRNGSCRTRADCDPRSLRRLSFRFTPPSGAII